MNTTWHVNVPEGTTVWLVRHGLREDSHPIEWFKTVGHMEDPDLAEIGKEMARRAGSRLAAMGERIDYVLSSPFLRTLRTADYLGAALDMPVYVEHGFHEQCQERWFETIPPVLPSLEARRSMFPRLVGDYASAVFPRGPEPEDDPEGRFGKRLHDAWNHVFTRFPGNVVVVGHYAVCNGSCCVLTGEANPGYIEMSSLIKLVYEGGRWHNRMQADASHVAGLHPNDKS